MHLSKKLVERTIDLVSIISLLYCPAVIRVGCVKLIVILQVQILKRSGIFFDTQEACFYFLATDRIQVLRNNAGTAIWPKNSLQNLHPSISCEPNWWFTALY